MWESEAEFMSEMVEAGCVFDTLVNDEGEQLVAWNWDVLEAKYPEVYEAMQQIQLEEVETLLSGMVDKGLLEMSFQTSEDGQMEAVYSLTEYGKEMASDMNPSLFE